MDCNTLIILNIILLIMRHANSDCYTEVSPSDPIESEITVITEIADHMSVNLNHTNFPLYKSALFFTWKWPFLMPVGPSGNYLCFCPPRSSAVLPATARVTTTTTTTTTRTPPVTIRTTASSVQPVTETTTIPPEIDETTEARAPTLSKSRAKKVSQKLKFYGVSDSALNRTETRTANKKNYKRLNQSVRIQMRRKRIEMLSRKYRKSQKYGTREEQNRYNRNTSRTRESKRRP